MAVCFDIFCPECDHIVRDVMLNSDETPPECPECREALNEEVTMKKMMGTTSFELKYDNRKDMCDWDGNTSQYWKQIKEEGGEEPKNDKQPEWY
jgi:hypothetical protein